MSQGKKIQGPYAVVDAQSMSASFQSNAIPVDRSDRVCLEILCTGSPVGTVSVLASVDYQASGTPVSSGSNPPNWFTMPLDLTALTGSAQNYFLDINVTSIRFLSINYTRTSGTGSMTAVVSAKES